MAQNQLFSDHGNNINNTLQCLETLYHKLLGTFGTYIRYRGDGGNFCLVCKNKNNIFYIIH